MSTFISTQYCLDPSGTQSNALLLHYYGSFVYEKQLDMLGIFFMIHHWRFDSKSCKSPQSQHQQYITISSRITSPTIQVGLLGCYYFTQVQTTKRKIRNYIEYSLTFLLFVQIIPSLLGLGPKMDEVNGPNQGWPKIRAMRGNYHSALLHL